MTKSKNETQLDALARAMLLLQVARSLVADAFTDSDNSDIGIVDAIQDVEATIDSLGTVIDGE